MTKPIEAGAETDEPADAGAKVKKSGSRLSASVRKADPIALSALLLSVVMALINAYYVLRHAEIIVTPPKQVLLYLDGNVESGSATLVAAIQLPMVNTAGQDHGDLLTEADLNLTDTATFKYESVIEPVFVDIDQEIECEFGYRCIRRGQLFVKQDYNAVFDLPGGLASARYANFPIHSFNCKGDDPDCKQYAGLDEAINSLSETRSQITLTLGFVGDGNREITCDLEGITEQLRKAVREYGWLALNCTNGKVTGAPWL